MGGRVHQPRHIERERVAEHGGHEPGVTERLAPAVHGNNGGENEANEGHQLHVVAESEDDQNEISEIV